MADFDTYKERLLQNPAARKAYEEKQAVLETGAIIREWREAADLRQQQLAEMIGSTQESISRLESGHSIGGPKLRTLAAIALACGRRLVVTSIPAHVQEDDPVVWRVAADLGTAEEPNRQELEAKLLG